LPVSLDTQLSGECKTNGLSEDSLEAREVAEDEIVATGREPTRWPCLLSDLARLSGASAAILFSFAGQLPAFASTGAGYATETVLDVMWNDAPIGPDGVFDAPGVMALRLGSLDKLLSGRGPSVRFAFPLSNDDTGVLVLLPNDDPTASLMAPLAPHLSALSRAVRTSTRLAMERGIGAMTILGGDEGRAAVIGARGEVLAEGAGFDAAIASCSDRDGRRLTFRDGGTDMRFAAAARALAQEGAVSALPLRDAEGRVAAIMHMLPIDRVQGASMPGAGLAVLVDVGSSARVTNPGFLRELFGLTPSEAVVAIGIANGMTVDELAGSQGKSIMTVRNQLKSVFAKTGLRRQSDLIRTVNALLPPAVYQLQHN
jgi:DNA-binding CsgD family transcriptional regulator